MAKWWRRAASRVVAEQSNSAHVRLGVKCAVLGTLNVASWTASAACESDVLYVIWPVDTQLIEYARGQAADGTAWPLPDTALYMPMLVKPDARLRISG